MPGSTISNVILVIVTTLWLGFIGFLDDYIKVFKKNKEGLRKRTKLTGQVVLGLIVGSTLYFHPDVVIREKAKLTLLYRVTTFYARIFMRGPE